MVDIASLGFKIDTSDVAKADSALDGLAATGAKTEAAAKAVQQSMSGVGKEAGSLSGNVKTSSQALDKFVASEQSAARAGSQFVQALRDQANLFGKSSDEIIRYQAAQLGVQKQTEPLIAQLRALREAQEASNQEALREASILSAAAASREAVSTSQYALIEGLRQQVALFGKSAIEIAEFEASLLGISSAAAPFIQSLRELEAAQEKAAAAARLEAEAQQSAAAARQALQTQQSGFIQSLQRQVDLFGKSNLEIAEYEAKLIGVSGAANPLIANLRELQGAQDRAAATAREEAEAQRVAAAAKQSARSQQDAFISSLREQAELQGKSREEVLSYRAAQLGVSGEAARYITRIKEFEVAQSQANKAVGAGGLSVKQYQQSLRQLPAQFSDIFISLQAGQSPFTVFLQQGAQIKDSFGGTGPALREIGRAALGMVNPLTISTAALAALAFAYKQGSDEGTAFNTALILTGNIAGTSVGQLQNAAAAMDKVSGTQRQAAQALAEVAGTGKFTSEQILSIASAAVAMEDATGKAIADTVSEFKKLADEPAAAAAKLNEQYNFLTASVYEQITALESQGDAAGAAQLAIDSFGQAMQDRANEITNDLGYIERAWKAIKDGAAEAWDEMLGVGRTQTPEQRLDELTNRGIDAERTGTAALLFGAPGAAISFGRQLYEQVGTSSAKRNEEIGKAWQEIQDRDEKAWVEGMQAQQEQDAIAAQQRIDQLSKSTLTNAEKRAKALSDLQKDLAKIRQVNPSDERLGADNVARLEANIADQFKDPKGPRAAKIPAVRDDAATRLLITLREQQAVLSSQLDAETKLTAEQKKRAEFESQIADLKTKGILTADQKSLLANQDAIRAQLDKNVALAEEVRLHNDSIKLQERSAQLQASIQSSAQGRREQQQRNLDAFGQGSAQQAQAEAAASIFREFRRYQDQLNKNTPKDLLGSAQYLEARAEIGQGLRDALTQHEDYYKRLKELQGSWQVGASQAFADYMDNAQNIAGQTSNIILSTMDELSAGISDSLVGAIRHGEDLRETMADVANTIFDQVLGALIEMGVRYGINAALEMAGIGAVSAAKIAATSTETGAEVIKATTVAGAEATAAGTVAAAEVAAIAKTRTASSIATKATTAEQVTAAGTTASSWLPASIAASIGSFGTAAAIGLAAVVAAMAFSGGFRKGGYTGNGGVNQAAGIVHGQEYVFDADAVKRIGVGNLEALRSGRDLQISGASAAAPGGQAAGGMTVVNQMSFPGITDSREAKRSTAQASRQIARVVAGAGRYN